MKKRALLHRPIFFIFMTLTLIFAQQAYAYLDPGTGSYILQLILAALFGSLYAVKLYWNKIWTFFKAFRSKKEEQ